MNKEKEFFEKLKREEADIQLIFIRHLLDREITEDQMGEFALQYTQLPEEVKWEVAKAFSEECDSCMDTWPRFLEGIEFVLEKFPER